MRTLSLPSRRAAVPLPALERFRLPVAGGAGTTIRVARFERTHFRVRVVAIEPCSTVLDWCWTNGAAHAIVGGFYMRPGGPPLGDLWIEGIPLPTQPIDSPWEGLRACVHADGRRIALAPRRDLPAEPAGDLLQAGPMLVADGRSLIRSGEDLEGFSAGSRQFDSDITEGRYPRAALGVSAGELIAVACEGRADHEAGLTMGELATAMRDLGAVDAINLDGGGSASLVVDGALLNTPREEHGRELVGGREIATALRILPR
jgi:Phosphodiester glycosidase